MAPTEAAERYRDVDIALIGMSGRFPGAGTIREFWNNLRDGVECLTQLTDAQLRAAGVPDEATRDPAYVRLVPLLAGIDMFDADFFRISPRDAEIMDPQHRIFLEEAWSALEHAGYDASRYDGAIGVFAGSGMNTYLANLYSRPDVIESVGSFAVRHLGNDKDFLATRVSYLLDLRGPSVNIQTACSTSLVAIHQACSSLINGECEIALAGGVSINVAQEQGYRFDEGGIFSPDGHCRAFDAGANGTISGNGAAVVVLKPVLQAIQDGDEILAVIKGSAINNDGAGKLGYMAPGVNGQASVIAEAIAVAEVSPGSISYIEAHGTGTQLGDRVELTALHEAMAGESGDIGHCGIGSLKPSVGHLDTAAGVAGVIKATLALRHRLIPASLNVQTPNASVGVDNGRFYVSRSLQVWESSNGPRRAGVSSFGFGGTNAHLVLEEAPRPRASDAGRDVRLLTISARSPKALQAYCQNLARHLQDHPEQQLADLAYTFQIGRRAFDYRRAITCVDRLAAIAALERNHAPQSVPVAHEDPAVVFMFPGQGSQYVAMGGGLYHGEPAFREKLDRCAEILRSRIGWDLLRSIFPESHPVVSDTLSDTLAAQLAMFSVEYSLAQTLIDWGICPQVMIGHSIGEYVAACVAGVWSLEDALSLVAERGRLMQELPRGSMLAVALSRESLEPYCTDTSISIAAVNGPRSCVASGPSGIMESLERSLNNQGIACRMLRTSHAFHSAMIDPALPAIQAAADQLEARVPRIPFISNLSGGWIQESEATAGSYWSAHARGTVRFNDGIEELLKEPRHVFVEVGPGSTLSHLLRGRKQAGSAISIATMPDRGSREDDQRHLCEAVGRLWAEAGVQPQWAAYQRGNLRRRVPAPTYPFERKRYWIDAGAPRNELAHAILTPSPPSSLHKNSDVGGWFYLSYWKPSPLVGHKALTDADKVRWLVFKDASQVSDRIMKLLRTRVCEAIDVTPRERFAQHSVSSFSVGPSLSDYESVLRGIDSSTSKLRIVMFTSTMPSDGPDHAGPANFTTHDFDNMVRLVKALANVLPTTAVHIDLVTDRAHAIAGDASYYPAGSLVLGPAMVVAQEYLNVTCRNIDFDRSSAKPECESRVAEQLFRELPRQPDQPYVAYRRHERWGRCIDPTPLESSEQPLVDLREGGTYVIFGGTGGIGTSVAATLAANGPCRLVLASRTSVPERSQWEGILANPRTEAAQQVKIRRLLELESAGAEVTTISVDISRADEMKQAMARVREQFGPIHGVVHAAGIVASRTFVPFAEMTGDGTDMFIGSKIDGMFALEQALEPDRPDFVLCMSSLSAIVGGLGFSAYAAANLFMDAFARRMNARGDVPWIAVNWDEWEAELAGPSRSANQPGAIRPGEGRDAIARILHHRPASQVLVSTSDLRQRIDQWINPGLSHDSIAADDANGTKHTRPDVATTYEAPANEIERRIAVVWQELLGIGSVGRLDNFYELGGHSLLGMQLMTRLRTTFQIEIPLRNMIEAPTVAEQAGLIVENEGLPGQAQTIARLRARIDDMSPEEIRKAIEQRKCQTE